MTKRQAVIPKDVVEKLVLAAGPRLILVGGQALAFWMDRFGITMPGGFEYVSTDIDFLAESAADSDAVRRLATALGGRSVFPRRRAALTALVGQAILDVSDEEVFNVDVLHKMWGADHRVRSRAVLAGDVRDGYRILHPLDLLKSRLDNLHGLKEKQNDLGKAQLHAGIEVAQAFQREAAATESQPNERRSTTLRYVGVIEHLATGAAGKKVASRHRIHVADAIEPQVVPSRIFHDEKLPQLARLMSDARRRELGLTP